MYLTVEQYSDFEQNGCEKLPNRFLEAFQPQHYSAVGYPFSVHGGEEIPRFVDCQHDTRFEAYYYRAGYKPTPDEFKLYCSALQSIYLFTKSHFGQGMLAKTVLLSAVHCFRKISAIERFTKSRFPELEDHPTIFELGPGEGVMGILLHGEGYPYIATDVS